MAGHKLIELTTAGDILIFKTVCPTTLDRPKRITNYLFINCNQFLTGSRKVTTYRDESVSDSIGCRRIKMQWSALAS